MSLKQRIVNKLSRISRKYKLLRPLVLAAMFVFLAFCHFFSYLYRSWEKFALIAVVFLVAFLGSSFGLPVLLTIDSQENSTLVYTSSLNELIDSGELLDLYEDEEENEEQFYDDVGNEDYDPEEYETFSVDDILLVNADLIEQYEANEAQEYVYDEESSVRRFSSDEWSIILVNKQHPIPDDYEMTLSTISGSMRCDERALPELLAMLKTAKNQGVPLIVCSPYRDMSKQVSLFERKVNAFMRKGLNYMDAYKMASQAVTIPGASEHQLGLSMDIYSSDHKSLDAAFGDTKAGKWLAEHAHEYGFILRYPLGKEYITSIKYEPWHFRYVGKEAAAIIYSQNLTLEEFWERYVD